MPRKYRIIRNRNDRFKVQHRGLWPAWKTFTRYHGIFCEEVDIIFDSRELAVAFLVRRINERAAIERSNKWKSIWP